MVHHIQTKTYSPITSRNPNPKIKKKHLHKQENYKAKNYALEFEITKSDLKSHKMGYNPITNLSNLVRT
jgi:hypothetical protein